MLKPILALTFVASAAVLSATSMTTAATPPRPYPKFSAQPGALIRTKVPVSPYAVPANSKPAGVWQSDAQVLPTAGCHPHCSANPNDGKDFGDPYAFAFSPRETPPDGYTYRYANPRFVSQWGNGCAFEVWNPFQSNAGGATLTGYARSEPCYFTVALDRFAVEVPSSAHSG